MLLRNLKRDTLAKRKLLPVALNSGVCWSKNSRIIKKGHIVIQILPSIDSNLEKKQVFNKVEKLIEEATNKLLN